MTREEAKNELVLWRNRNSDNGYHKKFVNALTVAIKALEQEPCGKDINVPATDAISRQVADIDKEIGDIQWHTWYKGIDEDVKKAFDTAIRHIQAWDKVKEDIKGIATFDNLDTVVEVMKIIDKHLQEVTNCE